MDIDEIRRKRAIKVIITDIIMAATVIVVIGILVAAVAGWRINKDFTVEQKGLLSVRSIPESASVIIDGELQHQTTNMSKMLSEGKHKVRLEKDGYESWEKDFEVTPGWLVRLEYPRLFKKNRENEVIKNFGGMKFFYVSPDNSTAIYSTDDFSIWNIMTDFNSTPKSHEVDLNDIFNNAIEDKYSYNINYIEWNRNNERVLVNITNGQTSSWRVIDFKNPKESVDVSLINHDISQARLGNDSNNLLALIDNNIVMIDLETKNISEPIAKNVSNFFLKDSDLIYLTNKNTIELIRIGEQKTTKVATLENTTSKVSLALTRFNSMSYILYTINNKLFVYQSNVLPNGEDDISNMKLIVESEINIIPEETTVSRNGEFIILRNNTKILVYDTELEKWHEYDYGDKNIRFLDDFILYRFDNETGKIMAWDFDNTNYRTLISDNGSKHDLLISNNNRYLYYINGAAQLIREKL